MLAAMVSLVSGGKLAAAPEATTGSAHAVTTMRTKSEAQQAQPGASLPAIAPLIPAWLRESAARSLLAVDGSRLALSLSPRQFALDIAPPAGVPQKTVFTFLNGSQGSVSNADDTTRVTGTFRVTESALDIVYEDGRTDTLTRKNDGGLALTTVFLTGAPVCTSWYPEGHAFSTAERQAAVAAYAARLGIANLNMGTPASCADTAPIQAEVTPPSSPAATDRRAAHTHRLGSKKIALLDDTTMNAAIAVRARVFDPIRSIAAGGGPIPTRPASSMARAKSAFSARKP